MTIPTSVNVGDLLLFFPNVGAARTTRLRSPRRLIGSADRDAHRYERQRSDDGPTCSRLAQAGDAGGTVTATFTFPGATHLYNRSTALLAVCQGGVNAVGTSVSASGATSYNVPPPATVAGQACVYFFAAMANAVGGFTLSSAGTQLTPVEATGYVGSTAGDATASGATAPAVTATETGATSPTPGWVAVTVTLT